MPTPVVNADTTIGALLVGTLVSYALFGVATTQAYIYYGRFRDDLLRLKLLVAGVWCGECAHTICIGMSIYDMLIADSGPPGDPVRLPPSLLASTLIGSLVSFVVQAFFALRIYVLTRPSASWLWTCIPILCLVLSFARLLPPNIVLFAFGIREPVPRFLARWGWLFDTLWAVSAANDLITAGTLVVLLWMRRDDGVAGTIAVVDKLIAWTIETGVVTSIASIIMMSVFVSMPFNFVWLAWFVVIPRLFSNSLFASLNSRAALRRVIDQDPSTGTGFDFNIVSGPGAKTRTMDLGGISGAGSSMEHLEMQTQTLSSETTDRPSTVDGAETSTASLPDIAQKVPIPMK
ncbi:hypothetical protein DFH06DRAFT_1194197 [Mycena polygramma]|nr:hypothetical protein DFH06DRAFT_1194197 [Mycena polygramma]